MQILLAIGLAFLFQPILPLVAVRAVYSISILFKDILMFVLPVLIFFYVSSSLASFKNIAFTVVFGLIAMIVLSNALVALTAYGVANLLLEYICSTKILALQSQDNALELIFLWPLKPFLKNEHALLIAALLGMIIIFLPKNVNSKISVFLLRGKNISTMVLQKCFLPILPLYVLGFAIKFIHDGSLLFLLQSYSKVFLLSSSLVISYIFIMYFIGAKFNFKLACDAIKNMLPAGLTGFSTMSSAIAMPVTLSATEKNTGDSNYTNFVVPASANIHMIGDGIIINLTALSLIYMSGESLPAINTYLVFTLYYCLAKFSAAGVPAGGMIVVLPVVEKYLGLSPDLVSLVATIYILQDTFATGANVMGNGAFAMVSKRIFKAIR